MQKEVGIKGAEALKEADLKVFSGGEGGGKSGFDLGKIVSSINVANDGAAQAVLNKIARPNDLGFGDLDIDLSRKEKSNKDSNQKNQKGESQSRASDKK